MHLAVIVLLLFGSSHVFSNLCPAATIYITPTNATTPDCPTDCPCFTLDHLARNELPKLCNSVSLSLYILQGVHNSTVELNFVLIQKVVIFGVKVFDDLENPPTLIRLLSSNLTFSDVSLLQIKHVEINGGGRSVLKMEKRTNSGTWSVVMKQVTMSGIVLQILPMGNNVVSEIHIDSGLFKMSRIEMTLCMYVTDEIRYRQSASPSVVHIENTRFLTEKKALDNSIILFSPMYFDSQTVIVRLDNVIFSTLKDTISSTSSLPPVSLCAGVTTVHNTPSDMYISSSSAEVLVTNSQFNCNFGTAIYGTNSHTNITNCTFSGYTQGVLIFETAINLKLHFVNTTVFNNSITAGEIAAAGLYVSSYGITQIDNCFFHRNVDLNGNSQIIKLYETNEMKIHDSKFMHNDGTVVNAIGTSLTLSGTVTFERNRGHKGVALSLSSTLKKIISIAEHTTVSFNHNIAGQFGGAIYIDLSITDIQSESNPSTNIWCFYGPLNSSSTFEDITLSFVNNSAGQGGDHIYGTSIKNYCKLNSFIVIGGDVWRRIFHIQPNATLSPVSSAALRICICNEYGKPQCANESGIFFTSRAVYPGEMFSISSAAVGAEFGTTVGEVYAKLLPPTSSTSSLGALGDTQQGIQIIVRNNLCTPLNYSLHSKNPYEIIYLSVTEETLSFYGDMLAIGKAIQKYRKTEVVPVSLMMAAVFVNVTVRFPCPVGFILIGNPPYCDCYTQLKQNNITCKIVNGTGYFVRQGSKWIGVGAGGEGVLLNDYCKQSYCKLVKVSVDLRDNPDTQCDFNHSGTLCGGCKEGYSLAIGSSHCLSCHSNTDAALFLMFISAGPLLYVLIAVFDLTITKGAINGLLFYANVVWICQHVLFPSGKAATDTAYTAVYVFKVFIAWLNLDFGIESCFIKGLDAYWKALLQYTFPIYIWTIGYIVVLIYRHTNFQQRYPCMAQILGKPTNVLVTFILLSYTKFIRNINDAFGFAMLTSYPNVSTEFVWALDGNVKYLEGKHIVLFVIAMGAAIASLIFSIYIFVMGTKKSSTIIAACSNNCRRVQIQRRLSHQYVEIMDDNDNENEGQCKTRCMAQMQQWKETLVNIPLPLYDALYAPLHNKHKYWLSMMLFVRIALLVTFTTTVDNSSKLNLLILLVVATVLLVFLASNNVYTDWRIQMVEGLSLGNLIFFSGGVLYTDLVNDHDQKFVIYSVSVGIVFIQFLGIVSHKFLVITLCGIRKCRVQKLMETMNYSESPTNDVQQVDARLRQLVNTSSDDISLET